jgi:hypothetical protein
MMFNPPEIRRGAFSEGQTQFLNILINGERRALAEYELPRLLYRRCVDLFKNCPAWSSNLHLFQAEPEVSGEHEPTLPDVVAPTVSLLQFISSSQSPSKL